MDDLSERRGELSIAAERHGELSSAAERRGELSIAAPATHRKLSFAVLAALVLLLALPRVARIAYPRAWAEDEQFFAAAELIRRGEEPYRDFIHVNLPLLEQMLAAAFSLGGTSLHTAEAFTACFALLGTLALARASIAGALLLASSALLFRYHVFEREVVYAGAAALAWALSPHAPVRTARSALAVGVLLGFGVCVKISAGAALGAYLVWMLVHRRGWKLCAIVAALGVLPAGALFAYYRWRHGSAVELQLFAFLLAKGTNAPTFAAKLDLVGRHFEPVCALAVAWLIGGARAIPGRGAACFALAWLACELSANVLLKRTIWPHNLLPVLFPLAYFAGRALEAFARALRARSGFTMRGLCGAAVAIAGVLWYALFALTWAPPGSADEKGAPECTLVHGFGGLARSDLAEAVRAIEVSPGDAMVASSDWIPALCGADPLFRFWESHGVWRELERAAREDRLAAYLESVRSRAFDARLAETLREYAPELREAWSTGRLRFLVSTNGVPLGTALGLPAAPQVIRRGPIVIEVLR